MKPPAWVWIVLAIPTIVSVAGLVVWVLAVTLRDWREGRRRRRRPPSAVLRVHGRPPAGTQNGGVRQRQNRAPR